MKKLSMRMRQVLRDLRDGRRILDFTTGHTLRALERRGLVVEEGRKHYGKWNLTQAGEAYARDS